MKALLFELFYMPSNAVFLNHRALASIIPGRVLLEFVILVF